MVDKEDSVFAGNRVSSEYVERIREDRMSRMLSNDVINEFTLVAG